MAAGSSDGADEAVDEKIVQICAIFGDFSSANLYR